MIAGAVAVVNDQRQRNMMIDIAAARFEMSKQSIRSFLCTYLTFQDIAALAPRPTKEKELTKDQKNMRWALNKFFYTRNQNSLPTAYAMMLKEKYCVDGQLLPEHPTYNQFRYFYRVQDLGWSATKRDPFLFLGKNLYLRKNPNCWERFWFHTHIRFHSAAVLHPQVS